MGKTQRQKNKRKTRKGGLVPSPLRTVRFKIASSITEDTKQDYLKWYKRMGKFTGKNNGLINLKFVLDGLLISVSYKTSQPESDDEIINEILADPDDDCNHPLFEKCVSGRVI